MPCPDRLSQWSQQVSTAFAHLSKPQVWGLVLWSAGIALSGAAGITQISALLSLVLEQEEQTVFQRLREWYLDAKHKSGKKQRNGFQVGQTTVDRLQWSVTMRTRSKLGMPCCVCNSVQQVEMHHVRHIRKTGGKKPVGFNAILQALNRKQIPVCTTCHQKIHRGDYDGMSLSDLAYNPYESEKRRRFRESRMR